MKHVGIIPRIVLFSGLMISVFFCGDPPSDTKTSKSNASIFFASVPPVADVYMDDVLIGKTNIKMVDVDSGEHKMTFKKDTLQYDTVMTFKLGKNPSVMVNFE